MLHSFRNTLRQRLRREPPPETAAAGGTGTDDSPATESDVLDPSVDQPSAASPPVDVKPPIRRRWLRTVANGLLPALALLLAPAAGYLKWQDNSLRQAQIAATQSVAAATESTIALLSYRPDTVEKDLGAARDRLTGSFRDAYTQLVHDVVIPGSKQKQITAVATVPGAASISASQKGAVVLVFVDQTVTVGNDAPTNTASTVRVTLEKTADKWLIAGFDPV